MKSIVCVGNPFDGMQTFGPFNDSSEAVEWTEPGSNTVTDLGDASWWVVNLENPYPEQDVTKDEDFDQFVKDATRQLRDLWEERNGKPVNDSSSIASLGSAIVSFFVGRR